MKIEDLSAYEDFLASERSAGMGGPFDRAAAWGLFCGDIGMWHLFGHGSLMLELTDTKECVGQVSINAGPNFPETELGWLLYEGYEGRGYATKAARVMRDWGFAELKLQTLVSYTSPQNFKSMSVAGRLGGIIDPTAPRLNRHDIVFRYSRP
jgi:RimJ/RimL family protein N-acetyltransferase